MAEFNFAESGRVKKSTPEELAAADEQSAIVVLSKGRQADGKPYFAYIAVKPSKYAEFMRLSAAHQAFNLAEYGDVICSASQAEPSEEIKKIMFEEYGFDDNFQESLIAEMKKQQVEFVGKQEEKRVMDIVAMLKKKKPEGNA